MTALPLPTRTLEQAKKDCAFSALQRALVISQNARLNLMDCKRSAENAGSKFLAAVIQGAVERQDDNIAELRSEVSTIEYEEHREEIEREERAEFVNALALASPSKTGRI